MSYGAVAQSTSSTEKTVHFHESRAGVHPFTHSLTLTPPLTPWLTHAPQCTHPHTRQLPDHSRPRGSGDQHSSPRTAACGGSGGEAALSAAIGRARSRDVGSSIGTRLGPEALRSVRGVRCCSRTCARVLPLLAWLAAALACVPRPTPVVVVRPRRALRGRGGGWVRVHSWSSSPLRDLARISPRSSREHPSSLGRTALGHTCDSCHSAHDTHSRPWVTTGSSHTRKRLSRSCEHTFLFQVQSK